MRASTHPPATSPAQNASGPTVAGHASLSARLRRGRRTVARRVLARRRLLAAVLMAVAVAAGLRVVSPPPPTTTVVPLAAHDLPSGHRLVAADVRLVDVASRTAPPRPADDAVGRVLAAPLDAGEAITETRLVGPAMLDLEPGAVPVPVRLPDPQMAGLLRVGDRVDLLAADLQGGARSDPATPPAATTVATDVPVLAVPDAAPAGGAAMSEVGMTGRLVVLGVPEGDVATVAQASAAAYVTFAWHRR